MLHFLYRLLIRWPDPPPKHHVCEEFTRWEACSQLQTVMSDAQHRPLAEEQRYEVTQYWQERRCTLCGFITQQPLAYDGIECDEEDE